MIFCGDWTAVSRIIHSSLGIFCVFASIELAVPLSLGSFVMTNDPFG